MVEPVRWATPGTEVDCACQPCDSASSTIQSERTPPPCPPMASTATQIGRSVVYRVGVGVPERSFMMPQSASVGEDDTVRLAPALQETDHRPAQSGHKAIQPGRIVDDVGAIERGAEHRGFRYLAAIATADAIIVDGRNRVVLERIVGMFDRERRTAGQPDTGVIAGADVLVDAETLAHHALPVAHRFLEQRFHPALLVEHAFR